MARKRHRDAQLRLWEREGKPRATPFVKWAGGKTQLLPKLRIYYPHQNEVDTYYEPFLGGGAVFFDFAPKSASLSDINEELITAYRVVKTKVEELIDQLKNLAQEYTKGPRDKYYEVRDECDLKDLDDVARTARFIFLNKTCYNGLYRVNRKGKFNVPFGHYGNPTICDTEKLRLASNALRTPAIRCMDYRKVLSEVGPSDFVYIDPPYQPISKTSSFTSYTKDQFDWGDQVDLANNLDRLSRDVGSRILVSSSKTADIERLYRKIGFKVVHVTAPRSISCDPSTRGQTSELLFLNY